MPDEQRLPDPDHGFDVAMDTQPPDETGSSTYRDGDRLDHEGDERLVTLQIAGRSECRLATPPITETTNAMQRGDVQAGANNAVLIKHSYEAHEHGPRRTDARLSSREADPLRGFATRRAGALRSRPSIRACTQGGEDQKRGGETGGGGGGGGKNEKSERGKPHLGHATSRTPASIQGHQFASLTT
jgi:hypothetical protein